MAGHQAQRARKAARTARDLAKRADDLHVEAARINLSHSTKRRWHAEVMQDAIFEFRGLFRVAVEKGDLIQTSAHRAFEAASGIGGDHVLQIAEGQQRFLAEHRQAFAECGCLSGDVVRACSEGNVTRHRSAAGDASEHGHRLAADFEQGAEDLELLHILGEVAAGHALVDVLVPGEIAKLLDTRLHVVTGHTLTLHDGGHVDLVLHLFVGLDHAIWHGDAEIALAFEHGDPVIALQPHFALRRPEGAHRGCGIAFGEDVGDGVGHGVEKGAGGWHPESVTPSAKSPPSGP